MANRDIKVELSYERAIEMVRESLKDRHLLTVEKLCRVLRALTAKDRAGAQQKAVDGQAAMYLNWAALADALEADEEEEETTL